MRREVQKKRKKNSTCKLNTYYNTGVALNSIFESSTMQSIFDDVLKAKHTTTHIHRGSIFRFVDT